MPPSTAAAAGTRAVPFVRDLATHGDRDALVTPDGPVSYRDLAERVDATARQLGGQRRLVLVAGANQADAIVSYLAALAGGHAVLLAPGGSATGLAGLVAAYDPDVVAGSDPDRSDLQERRPGSSHELHPELALLLTTSGSTGSAKLVRLSHENLQANAEAIASYLGLDAGDRAATTLPMHYCYGLSVVHSHLLRGASLLLTDHSVADAEFWQLFREHRATSLAGVPYTFDLLDRVGFDDMELPHLRYLTQAGGRLAPERVRHYAELGRRRGWDLFVMYGQTEATARMAYLPPDLARAHPGTIGVPVPGGAFRLAPLPDWPEPDTGELVYQGPNVMLGYATDPADLALGWSVDELRTGDVARRTREGLYEIVGRRSWFVKLFGLRVDLQQVEALLADHGISACCVGQDGELVVAVTAGAVDAVAALVPDELGLPARAIRVCALETVPRLPNGKPDYAAVRHLARATPAGGASQEAAADESGLCELFAWVLGRPDVTGQSTFVSLGGDSLSYVEMSIRLEQALGRLPDSWHTTPIRDLCRLAVAPPAGPRAASTGPGAGDAPGRWSRLRAAAWSAVRPAAWRPGAVDTSVALRAVSIILIVGTHSTLFGIAGGAHLLLGVAGFNFARFHLAAAAWSDRTRRAARSVGRVVFASMTWIALVVLLTDHYSVANILLLNYLVDTGGQYGWHFWFIETLVYIQVAVLALLAVPAVDRLARRYPFGLPMALALAGLVTRYELVPGELATPLLVFWLFALGWAAGNATATWHRVLVTVAVVATVPGFFESWAREAVIVAGLVLLVWVARLPSLRPLNRLAGVLAGASLYIYLTHWQVYPHLYQWSPAVAVAASLAVGIGYAAIATRLTQALAASARPPSRWVARKRSAAA